ncbi:methyltransferase domain-containing protein [Puniceicoccales bacterium CK1056]|uniref:Methyltransferase domain-containing protein n=1 Tax=Oceanipulchritudo coccoides TaxID=2706888 RepID=A0A6B2M004_9BACT|nr:methyltransferase domain-containing protein [Oceanipulchritudo coccoides]NDV61639.1 methyltransferase domain-containing protein [Oceanipulchritudo coccoides]
MTPLGIQLRLRRYASLVYQRIGLPSWSPEARYLKQSTSPKLHIGCGHHPLDSWLNTDMHLASKNSFYLNATRRFPYPDNAFDYIFSEHLIEHLSYSQGRVMLDECFRVLRPGGVIRTATPDLAFVIGTYFAEPDELTKAYLDHQHKSSMPWAPADDPVYYINNFVRDWGHQFIYDRESLSRSLADSGFIEVRELPVCESSEPALCELENTTRKPREFFELETIVIEAQKPPVSE